MDLTRSRAVLIGTWDYEHLEPVPAARNSLERMCGLLTGPLCGWPADRVTVIGNRAGPGDLHDQLIELFSDTSSDGVALFYFVGHGQLDDQERLCLGLVGSRTDYNRRASTSLRFDDVRGALVACSADTKVVMLDCCFAGSATKPRQSLSGADVLDMVRGVGAYTMAASGAYLPAWFETDGSAPQTYFTQYFVDVVESGIAGEPAGLTLDRIYVDTHERLVRDGKPEPTHTARHQAGRTVFARNAAPVEEQVDLGSRIAQLEAKLRAAEAEVAALRGKAEEPERMRAEPDSDALASEADARAAIRRAEARQAEAAEELHGLRAAVEIAPGQYATTADMDVIFALEPPPQQEEEGEPRPVVTAGELAGLQQGPDVGSLAAWSRSTTRRKTVARYAIYLPLALLLGLPLTHLVDRAPAETAMFLVSATVLCFLAWRLRIRITDSPGNRRWLGSVALLRWTRVAALLVGAATGYLINPVGEAVRAVLTWGS